MKLTDRDHGYHRVMRGLGSSRMARRLRVGVMGDDHTQMVAAVQEFGSSDGRVPERPYLRPWYDKNVERIKDHLRVVAVKALHGPMTQRDLLGALGRQYRGEIQEEILHGIRPELAPATIKAKARRGDPATPLVTSEAHLLSSINATVDGEIV